MSNSITRSSLDQTIESTPLGDQTEFAKLIADMVTDHAPRLFAVVIEYGDRLDAQLAAWGLAFEDHSYVITVDGRHQYAVAEPDNVLRYICRDARTTPRLVWVTQNPQTV